MTGKIRVHDPSDLSSLLKIWKGANAIAHPFLTSDFVSTVAAAMETQYLPDSDTWVYAEADEILGFVSMMGNEIGGLFVDPNHHRKGIGKALVKKVAEMHEVMEVEVFNKNLIARPFYEKEGFSYMKEYVHEPTGEVVIRLKRKQHDS